MRMLVPYLSTLVLTLLLLSFPAPSIAQVVVSPTTPLPLEVRSPYLNFWTAPINTTSLSQAFPGRTALLRIDGVTYSIFGRIAHAKRSNVTETTISPTRTIFTFDVGPVEVVVTFFSPIEPGDWVRQSIPFTFLSFGLNVTDGKAHDIQLYVHMQSGGFFGLSDAAQRITWSTVSTGQSVYQMTQLENQRTFSETADGQAKWGQFYFATAQSHGVTYGIGSANTLMSNFSARGRLGIDPAKIYQMDGLSDITSAFAFSRNLSIIKVNATAVFAFGFVQDPAVQYIDPAGQSQRRVPYFKAKYPTVGDLIDFIVDDYTAAVSRGFELDSSILNYYTALAPRGYSVFLSLTTRLVYASTVLTVGETSEGVVTPTDVMMFMKNIDTSSSARVNPVEVLCAAFPMFMYLDPRLGPLLLEPLLRQQSVPEYAQLYAPRDAGTSYPNVSFANVTHSQGVEQTANMLIMMYAYARASGNGNLIETYYNLLSSWAEYLVGASLYTTNQESADLLSVNNQTNLAIKGIIAIKAMANMSAVVGKSTDYSATANKYYNQWKGLAFGSDNHLLAQYEDESSWSLGYNMFVDRWLQTGLISQDIFTAHVNFLKTVNITASSTFNPARVGLPLDSLRPNNVTYSSNMFVLGFADTELKELITSGMESHPLAEDVSVNGTTFSAWFASPDLGSAYASFMLTLPFRGIAAKVNPSKRLFSLLKFHIAIAVVVGSAILTFLFFMVHLLVNRRRRAQRSQRELLHKRKNALKITLIRELSFLSP